MKGATIVCDFCGESSIEAGNIILARSLAQAFGWEPMAGLVRLLWRCPGCLRQLCEAAERIGAPCS